MLCAALAFGQVLPGQSLGAPKFSASYDGGVYYSLGYQYSTSVFAGGQSTSGTYSIQLFKPFISTQDGRSVYIFSGTNGVAIPPITIGSPGSSTQETVTPSASANCTGPTPPGVFCTLTATFANGHGQGDQIISGDQGVLEAIADASLNGGGMVWWQIDSGPLTLSTGSQSTTISAAKIPIHSTVVNAVGRVTTTITGCAGGWSLGYSTGVEFTPADTTLTAGNTTDTLATQANLYNVSFNVASTNPIIFCTTGAATAGAVHARIQGYKMAPPAF